MAPATIGVLALQGDFALHFKSIERLCGSVRKVRLPADLAGLDGLILPGGESTTQVKLSKDYGLFDALREAGFRGLPMFGTCAGAILLGKGTEPPERLGIVPVEVRRNAYGRQIDSFEKPIALEGIPGGPVRCVFIRAPKFDPNFPAEVKVLGRDGRDPILLRHGTCLLSAFHPELTDDLRVHRLFLEMCASPASSPTAPP